METHAKTQAVGIGCFLPSGKKVFFGPHVYRIPAMVFAVPAVEVVMDNVFETELRGMPIFLQMGIIDTASLKIHFTGIPVAFFRLTLGTPVRPDSKLCISKPIGGLIVLGK